MQMVEFASIARWASNGELVRVSQDLARQMMLGRNGDDLTPVAGQLTDICNDTLAR